MKLKILLFFGGLAIISANLHAQWDADSPIAIPLIATTVSASTSTWTAVPTNDTAGRILVHISNPASNNAAMAIVLSTSSTTPGEATTVRPHEYEPGEGDWFIMPDSVYMYALSLHTSAESIHVQEYKE